MDVDQMSELVRQIGRGRLMAISGGRVENWGGVLRLPVSNGYRVEIALAANDTYIVRRVFRRKPKGELIPVDYPKGERTEVYCEEVGEAAYYASCFRSYDENEWVSK